MEKQPNANGKKQRTRLLTCFSVVFCIFTLPNFAQDNELNLTVKPVASQFFVNRPIEYVLTIPNVRPASVTYALQALPRGFSLVSARKESASGIGQPVTRILFEFTSTAPGPIELPELIVSINDGWIFGVPFERAMLAEDPMKMRPFLVLRPESNMGAEVGKPYALMLYARNVAAITGLDLDLDEDALFSVTARLNALETGEGLALSLSREVPLARLEWLPLKTGLLQLPAVNAHVKAFAGDSSTIRPGNTILSVESASPSDDRAQEKQANPFAFDDIDPSAAVPLTASPAADSAAVILSALQHAVENVKKSRRVFFIFLTAFILLGSIVVFAIVTRRFKVLIPAAVMLAVVAFGAVKTGIPVLRPSGIFIGGEIKAVPEFSSSPVGNFPPGTPLIILKKSKTWYYVLQDKAVGWVPAELVVLTDSGKVW
jgi:hypothetical protein